MFVLDRNTNPLQPCHPARARKLLRAGRARVHRYSPFVIRLTDRTIENSTVQGAEVGIDPGSRATGLAVFTTGGSRRGLYAIELGHRGNQIRDQLTKRANYRRGRRSRNLRYRAPRSNNRTRPEGWVAPSLHHRVDTTLGQVARLARWAPVTGTHVERVAFDTHALTTGQPLAGVEYQHGTLAGTETREYLLQKWGRRCVYCHTSGVPLNIDHLQPRSHGGSDRIANLTLACIPCNQHKGSRPVEEFLATKPERLAAIRRQAQTPLTDAAAVNATRWALWRALDDRWPTRTASGGRTTWNRHRTGLPKSHTLDAPCVGVLDTITRYPGRILAVEATGHGSYARTRPNKHGFPRLYLPRSVRVRGFATGDLVRAVVPSGKKAGTHTGRVAVRSSGSFNIRTPRWLVQGIHHRHIRRLQPADGYTHHHRKEESVSSPA